MRAARVAPSGSAPSMFFRVVPDVVRLWGACGLGESGPVQAPSSVEQVSEVDRVLLAAPRGFCAGVEKAVKALAWMVRVFDPPIYCYHEIVHNRIVVEEFERRGVVFVDDVALVPPGAAVMLSAHGSAPEVEVAAGAGICYFRRHTADGRGTAAPEASSN